MADLVVSRSDDTRSGGSLPGKICPLMLVARNHKDLSAGVPEGALNGNYACLGESCMAFRKSTSTCGLVPQVDVDYGDIYE